MRAVMECAPPIGSEPLDASSWRLRAMWASRYVVLHAVQVFEAGGSAPPHIGSAREVIRGKDGS